jgi:hypothetical protein
MSIVAILLLGAAYWQSVFNGLTNYAFFAALFAAFNGSTVADPANPRRSRGGFLALVITM